jgi:hypothetical protein
VLRGRRARAPGVIVPIACGGRRRRSSLAGLDRCGDGVEGLLGGGEPALDLREGRVRHRPALEVLVRTAGGPVPVWNGARHRAGREHDPPTLVMLVNPSVPAKTVPEFIAYAKANPGKINFASAGIGSTLHVAGELFKMMTGVSMVHVPYRGEAPALTDLLGGQAQMMFGSMQASIQYIRAGSLRALAVTNATRWDGLPDIPTVGEFVAGFEVSDWYGIGVPKKTPAEIVEKLSKEINVALADPKLKARFADLGGTVFAGSPAEFGKFIAEDTEKWAKVVKFSRAKVE